MGALMRAHDWSKSPLGDPAHWPDTLKMAVATCLNSRFPMVVWLYRPESGTFQTRAMRRTSTA